MKFDYCIGNPPYQEEQKSLNTEGSLKNYAVPVYNVFMDAANQVAERVELIHPARFLFDAGSTPKAWNEKMLNDPHFKVLEYKEDATSVFPNTDIKGGIAVTYKDHQKNFGSIGVFTPHSSLAMILEKIRPFTEGNSISDIGISGYAYHFTEKMHEDYPNIKQMTVMVDGKTQPLMSKGHEYDLKSNIIEKLPMIFHDKKPDDGELYVTIVGRQKNERVNKYIKKEYLNDVTNLNYYKLFIPRASGIGSFGETLGQMLIASPLMGHTETFFSIGTFSKKEDAEYCMKYLKTKFSRALLSVLKITQNFTPSNFRYVPLQDFTSSSDIDWSKSIKEIDQQLYHKYGLEEEEIEFIETHVKEMV